MKSILLIGLGRFGKHIALELNRMGHEVMAVDTVEDRVEALLPFVTNAQIGDSTNEDFLKSLGITPTLSTLSKIVLIILMFLGRVGGLTLIFAAMSGVSINVSRLPKEKITVG